MCFDSTTQSQTQLPDWLTGAAQSTVGQAQTAQTDETAAGYQPLSFTGTGLTDASQLQDQGFNNVSNDQGAWVQQFEQGQGALSSALNQPSALSAGSPLINSAAGTSALNSANPLIAAGTGAGGLATAQPFLSAASATAPGAIQSYLSPYTSDVVNNISRLGNQNLTENILPAVNDTFTGAGQFGSDRNAQQVGRAVRDTQTNISGLQAQALESGYGTAGSLFESDAARQAGLAGTAGSLGESAAGRDLSGASLTGSLATSDAARQLAAGQALGSLQATTTGQDLSASQQAGALAAEQQGLTASDNSQLLGAGGVQYGINAANNATAQQNAQQQNVISQQNALQTQQYPEQQLSFLNSIIRGTPTGQSTTTTSPSTSASSLGALGLLGAGLASKYNWFRDGGRVSMADGGDPGDDEFDPLQRELALRRLSALANTDPTASQVSDAGALSSVPPPQAPSDPGYVVGGASPTAADTMLNRQPSADDIRVPSDGALAQAAQAPPAPSGGALSAGPTDAAPMGALAQHLKQSTYSDADIKDAMDNVKDLQKSALAPRARKDSWANDPIIITALGALASGSPNPFTALGKGALGAVENEVSNRKQDYALDKESRIEALKAAQQNLSNIVSMRRDDTTRAIVLGRGDIAGAQIAGRQQVADTNAAKPSTDIKTMTAMGLDPTSADDRNSFAQFKATGTLGAANIHANATLGAANIRANAPTADVRTMGAMGLDPKNPDDVAAFANFKNTGATIRAGADTPEIKTMKSMGFDPTNTGDQVAYAKFKASTGRGSTTTDKIQRWAGIAADENMPQAARDAASRMIDTAGKPAGMTPNQFARLYSQADARASADLGALLKDNQFPSADAQEAYRQSLVQKHLAFVMGGVDPSKIPPPEVPPGMVPKAPAGGVSRETTAPVVTPAPAATSPLPRSKVDAAEMGHLRNTVSGIDNVIPDLDRTIAALEADRAGGPASSKIGLPAHAIQLFNATAGQALGDLSPENDAFWSRMKGLKPRLEDALGGSDKLKAQYSDLSKLLDNDKMFQSTDTALSNLREMRSILSQNRQTAYGRLTAAPGGGTGLAKGTPPAPIPLNPADRKVGTPYTNSKGQSAIWLGNGQWEPVGAPSQ